jgi:hypothetical protein
MTANKKHKIEKRREKHQRPLFSFKWSSFTLLRYQQVLEDHNDQIEAQQHDIPRE